MTTRPTTVNEVLAYIDLHTVQLGFKPTAIAMHAREYHDFKREVLGNDAVRLAYPNAVQPLSAYQMRFFGVTIGVDQELPAKSKLPPVPAEPSS